MMMGLSVLMIYGFSLQVRYTVETSEKFDIFNSVKAAEWDTLLLFFGVVFAVGGLGYIGYLELMSAVL